MLCIFLTLVLFPLHHALLLLLNEVVDFDSLSLIILQVLFSSAHLLAELFLGCMAALQLFGSCLAYYLRAEQFSELVSKLFIALLILELPDFLFLVLIQLEESLVASLCFHNIVTVVFVRFVRLGAVWEDLDRIGKPARVVPAGIKVTGRKRALLEQLSFIPLGWLNAHVLQIPRCILVLD